MDVKSVPLKIIYCFNCLFSKVLHILLSTIFPRPSPDPSRPSSPRAPVVVTLLFLLVSELLPFLEQVHPQTPCREFTPNVSIRTTQSLDSQTLGPVTYSPITRLLYSSPTGLVSPRTTGNHCTVRRFHFDGERPDVTEGQRLKDPKRPVDGISGGTPGLGEETQGTIRYNRERTAGVEVHPQVDRRTDGGDNRPGELKGRVVFPVGRPGLKMLEHVNEPSSWKLDIRGFRVERRSSLDGVGETGRKTDRKRTV